MQVSKPKKGYKLVDVGFGKSEESSEDWEYLEFLKITKSDKIKKIKIQTSHYLDEGKYPIIDQGQDLICGFTNNSSLLYKGNLPIIIFGDHTLVVKYIDCPFAIGADGTKVIQINNEKCIPKFLYYSILGKNISSEGYKRHFSKLRDQKFFIPRDLKEQQKILLMLSNVDDTLQKTNQLIQKTELLKKGLMQKLLTKGIGHTKFKKIEWGYNREIKIPKEWEFVSLESSVLFQEGPGLRDWQFTTNGVKVINIGNIVDGKLDISTTTRYISQEEFDKKYTHFALDENDIVISSSGWSYGKIAIVKKSDLPLMLNTSVIRFKSLNDKIIQKFLFSFLSSVFFKKQIEYQITGIDIPNFGSSHLKKMKIILPPINEQEQIASIVSNVDSQIQKEKLQKSNLEILKKGLMQKLLTGKIRVKI